MNINNNPNLQYDNFINDPYLEIAPTTFINSNEIIEEIVEHNNFEKALEMIDHCEDLEAWGDEGMGIVHWSACCFHINPGLSFQIISKCLERGVDANAPCEEGLTPLHYLVESVQLSDELLNTISMIIAKGADPCITNDNDTSAVENVLSNSYLNIDEKLKLTNFLLANLPENERWQEINNLFFLAFSNKMFDEIEADDIVALIYEHHQAVNLNFLVSSDGYSLIYKALSCSNETYTADEKIRIVDALLSCGASPHEVDENGSHIITHVLADNSYSAEDKVSLLTSFRKHGQPLLQMNYEDVGIIQYVIGHLDHLVSSKEQEQILDVIVDGNIYQEIMMRRLLVNSFNITNYRTEVYGEQIPIDGGINISKLISPLLVMNSNYYKRLVNELKSPLCSEYWSQIVEKIDDNTFNELTQIDPKSLFKVLLEVPKLLNGSIKSQRKSSEDIFNMLSNFNDKEAIYVGHYDDLEGGHVIGYYSYNNYLLISNKGYGAGDSPGVTIYDKNKLSNLKDISEDLSKKFDAKKFMNTHFPDRNIINYCLNKKDRVILRLPQKPQIGGNCPIASFNSLELGILFMQLQELSKNISSVEQIARAIKKTHTSLRREELLDDYLQAHTSNDSTSYDRILLYTLATLNTSNAELDTMRFIKIYEWAQKHDQILLQILNEI